MTAQTRIVRFHEFGGPGVLRLQTVDLPEPREGEVRLRMRALGMNRADALFRQGKYVWKPPLPSRIGVEGSGIVEAVGPGGQASLVGKSVLCLPNFSPIEYGVYGETAIVPQTSIATYPDNLSHEEAAAALVQYLTAWGALVHFGQVGKGEHVLLTAASSSTGIAAIQVVKAQGGISIATTRSAEKAESLRQLGADHVIIDGQENIVEHVHEITGGDGARIAYDPIAGESLTDMVGAMAKGGLILEYGVLSDRPTVIPMMDAFPKYLTIKVYDVHEILESPDLMESALAYLFERLANGVLKPIISKTFLLDRIAQAHEYLEAGNQIGKIVVTVP